MESKVYKDGETGLTLRWWPVGGSGTSFFFIGDITGEIVRVPGSQVYLFGVEPQKLVTFMQRTNSQLTKDFSLSSSIATKIRRHLGMSKGGGSHGGARAGAGKPKQS
ncbi:MAG: hypothetical protein AAF902_05815 [Chloroflexota bacterium]